MASHKSALKKERQDRVSRIRNRSHASRLKTEMKKFRELLTKGDAAEAAKALRKAEALLDHSATLGVIHSNAAARTKSRLARQTAALPRS